MRPMCEFAATDTDRITCRRCGRTLAVSTGTAAAAERVFAPCRAPCRHLGGPMPRITVDCACREEQTRLEDAHVCSVRGRCLPHYRPEGEVADRWAARLPEAAIYALCYRCADYARDDDALPA